METKKSQIGARPADCSHESAGTLIGIEAGSSYCAAKEFPTRDPITLLTNPLHLLPLLVSIHRPKLGSCLNNMRAIGGWGG